MSYDHFNSEKKYKCDKCLTKCHSLSALKYHMTRHEEPKIKCPYENCDHKVKWKKDMKNHIDLVHLLIDSRNIFGCLICNCIYSSQGVLTQHIKTKHNTEL